jgi:hypothetical protein
MNKKVFYSRLIRKNVIPDDPDYWFKVLAEKLFRIDYLKEKKCTCLTCQNELISLEEFLPNIKTYIQQLSLLQY